MAAKGQFVDMGTRLMRHVEPCPMTGCWLFFGKPDKDGYGTLHNRSGGGGDYKAHRVSWETHVGDIPAGMDVAHHCDVRCCVSPSHLYIATRSQNIADRTARKREPRGEQSTASKVSNSDVYFIRASDLKIGFLAEMFNISRAQIHRIKNGESWAHIKC